MFLASAYPAGMLHFASYHRVLAAVAVKAGVRAKAASSPGAFSEGNCVGDIAVRIQARISPLRCAVLPQANRPLGAALFLLMKYD